MIRFMNGRAGPSSDRQTLPNLRFSCTQPRQSTTAKFVVVGGVVFGALGVRTSALLLGMKAAYQATSLRLQAVSGGIQKDTLLPLASRPS